AHGSVPNNHRRESDKIDRRVPPLTDCVELSRPLIVIRQLPVVFGLKHAPCPLRDGLLNELDVSIREARVDAAGVHTSGHRGCHHVTGRNGECAHASLRADCRIPELVSLLEFVPGVAIVPKRVIGSWIVIASRVSDTRPGPAKRPDPTRVGWIYPCPDFVE